MADSESTRQTLYALIANEEDARVCTDISDQSCQVVPKNFFLILFSGMLSKLGDELCNAKTVLPWLLNFVQAPSFLIGALVPIRESGSLIPQLFIAGFVRKLAVRKYVWVAGSIIQGISVGLMGLSAYAIQGLYAGLLIILLLVVFSLARGLCSVAHKDVVGKTIPRQRRGRLGGLSASVAGVIALITGLLFITFESDQHNGLAVVGLLAAAAISWILAAAVFLCIDEFKGETGGGGNAFYFAIASISLVKSESQFRLFVCVRSLLLCSALSAPFFVQLASQSMSTTIQVLGMFIVANSIASIVSGPVWGIFADHSSRKVMIASALTTSTIAIVVVAITLLESGLESSPYTYPIAFLLLGIAHNGVRLGRKTYLIDMAKGNRRTEYVAVSNTIIGGVLLLVGLVTAILSAFSIELTLCVLAAAGLIGALMATRLHEV